MKTNKKRFDEVLAKLLSAKPTPRKKIKTQGRHGPKTQLLPKA